MDARWALVRVGGGTHHVEALRARDSHAGPLRLAEGLGPSGTAGDRGQVEGGARWCAMWVCGNAINHQFLMVYAFNIFIPPIKMVVTGGWFNEIDVPTLPP